MKQLLLFEETIEEILKREITTMKEKIESTRKGQWGTIGELKKEVKDLRSEIEFLKSHICKTGLF